MSRRRTIENETSSSDLVLLASPGGVSFTLDPMETAVMKIDVYDEELAEFIEALVDVAHLALDEPPVLLSREQAETVLMVLEEDMAQLEPVEDEAWLGQYPGEDEVSAVGEVHTHIMEQVTTDDA